MSVLKYSYMDHWFMHSPTGPIRSMTNLRNMERYAKQIAGLGFKGMDIFGFHIMQYSYLFGSFAKYNEFLRDIGMEKCTSIFHCYMGDNPKYVPHLRECQDNIVNQMEGICEMAAGNGVEKFIMMPAGMAYVTEPVNDDKIKVLADLWNRAGEMTQKYDIQLVFHHEFWNGIRTEEDILRFYELTDPRYVFFFCDTAQHVIAGVDPVKLYCKLHDRIGGFHLKDTHNVDLEEAYRIPPDAELMAPSVPRWFFEAGTPEGLVDFKLLYKAMKDFNYQGWVSVEHDKAEIGGGNFSESTAVAMWYIRNVLSKIYD